MAMEQGRVTEFEGKSLDQIQIEPEGRAVEILSQTDGLKETSSGEPSTIHPDAPHGSGSAPSERVIGFFSQRLEQAGTDLSVERVQEVIMKGAQALPKDRLKEMGWGHFLLGTNDREVACVGHKSASVARYPTHSALLVGYANPRPSLDPAINQRRDTELAASPLRSAPLLTPLIARSIMRFMSRTRRPAARHLSRSLIWKKDGAYGSTCSFWQHLGALM
uniref:Uncharacterized protein n=1 Tax=Knipowitschia caucasica TaxID=637954 RepID=A0AAV2K5E2_KNICA